MTIMTVEAMKDEIGKVGPGQVISLVFAGRKIRPDLVARLELLLLMEGRSIEISNTGLFFLRDATKTGSLTHYRKCTFTTKEAFIPSDFIKKVVRDGLFESIECVSGES